MTPKFSIIMPVFNNVNFIEESIKSVINQTYENIEFIIVDGNSTDGSLEVINNYSTRINLIISEKDLNMWHAYNKGIIEASGDYIGFLAADDVYLPNALEYIADHIIKNIDSEIIYGEANRIDEFGNLLGTHNAIPYDKNILLHKRCYIPHQSIFIRKDVFPKVGLYDINLKWNGDWDYWKRCAILDLNFSFIDKIIGCWRVHRNSITYGGSSKEYYLRNIETFKNARKYSTKVISTIEIRLIPHIIVGILGLRLTLRNIRDKLKSY